MRHDDRRLYLIDAMAFAYRSHFSFVRRPLINSNGEHTSAAYGFTSALLKLMADHDMRHIAAVFDVMGDGGTFRSEIFADYKAHRDPPPENLLSNLPWIKEILAALDISVIEELGVEADDVIGTLARQAEADGADVVIVSPDKDFQQLLSPRITVLRPAHRGESYDPITPATFKARYGLDPGQYIDYLALTGDAVDNVPGVPGIGPKRASALIKEFGAVEDVLRNIHSIAGARARAALQDHSEEALLSKLLVTIKTDVDIDLDWMSLRCDAPNRQALDEWFHLLEFRGLMRRLDAVLHRGEGADKQLELLAGVSDAYDPNLVDYRIIGDLPQLREVAKELAVQERFALDTETTSVDVMEAALVGVSLSWEAGQGVYAPTPLPDGTTTEVVLSELRQAMHGMVIGQNLKYDSVILLRHGLRITGKVFDTMVAHHLIAPEGLHNLDALCLKVLNYKTIPISDLIGAGENKKSMRDVPINLVGPYACEDADLTLRLYEALSEELEHAGVAEEAYSLEFPLVSVLSTMERTGICMDIQALAEASDVLDAEMCRMDAAIYEAAGQSFKISSSKQLGEVLFQRLGLRVVSKTSSGKPSTKESVLVELAAEHPLPGLLLERRACARLKSAFVTTLRERVHPRTGRIHLRYYQIAREARRFGSSNPNLHGIPQRAELGGELRAAFVPCAGWVLMSADYAQLAMRILASVSGEPSLMQNFGRGADIHKETAARVFRTAPEEVDGLQRREAKEINDSVPHGVSAQDLARRLRCSLVEARAIIKAYARAYPKVTRWRREFVADARRQGFVETLQGRRRPIPNIGAQNRVERSIAARAALTTLIHGSRIEMIKSAMVRIQEGIRKEELRGRILLQARDEIVLETPPQELDAMHALVAQAMAGAVPAGIPVVMDVRWGKNWLEAR